MDKVRSIEALNEHTAVGRRVAEEGEQVHHVVSKFVNFLTLGKKLERLQKKTEVPVGFLRGIKTCGCIENMERNDGMSLELKYCERCGTLGLRRGDSGQTYCGACWREMARVYLAPSEHRPVEMDGRPA